MEKPELSVPAVLANRFTVSATDLGVRVSFGEGIEPTHWRAAFVLTAADALALAETVRTVIEQAVLAPGDAHQIS